MGRFTFESLFVEERGKVSLESNQLFESLLLLAQILRFRVSWYRAQKPLKPGNTEKIRESHEIPDPGSGPENTKKIRKRSFSGHFRTFSVFFSYFFRARPGVGDFVTFSYFFRISGLEGFLRCIPGMRNRNSN